MPLFAPQDEATLIADPGTFREPPDGEYERYTREVLRNALALELLFQLREQGTQVLTKGGTPLQARLAWPPTRASIDLDIETTDVDDLRHTVNVVLDQWKNSGIRVRTVASTEFGERLDIEYGGMYGERRLRLDVAGCDTWPDDATPWREPPRPWARATPPLVQPLETQAAQKLLLAADPPYGRDTQASDWGRKSRIKDVFDLACLASAPLDADEIRAAARRDHDRKDTLMEGEGVPHFDVLREQGMHAMRRLAYARDAREDTASLWRAFSQVRPTIRQPVTETEIRIAAGCAHHLLAVLGDAGHEWSDAWRPYTKRAPRRAWAETAQIETWVEIPDGAVVRGVQEAWARPSRPATGGNT